MGSDVGVLIAGAVGSSVTVSVAVGSAVAAVDVGSGVDVGTARVSVAGVIGVMASGGVAPGDVVSAGHDESWHLKYS